MSKDNNNDEMKKLREKLALEPKMIWDQMTEDDEKAAHETAEEYKVFLDECRTERLSARWVTKRALEAGFVEPGDKGDKLVLLHRGKVVGLGWLGQKPISEGVRIVGAHIDCPRLDLKTRPLFENEEITFLKTQYYGGIRKYQWLARPLAIVGPVFLADGSTVEINIGLKPEDPVFTMADLLPHLARKQGGQKLSEVFVGEKLNVIVGTKPLGDPEVKERFKLAVLKELNERYGMVESDFISADLEIVPADAIRDVGFDRALIGGYGHDDRVSSWCAYKAAMELLADGKRTERPGLVLLVDKEETGSDGNTGAKSMFMSMAVARMLEAEGLEATGWRIQEALFNSWAVSADVCAVFDPDWPEVHEKRNAAFFGYGPCLVKYTGSGGKYSTNDANAEFVGWLRRTLDADGVIWQAGGLGKVDEGGGGTIAKFMAEHGMEVVDMGTPVLGMHSPFELVSKVDVLHTVRAFRSFLAAK